MEEIEWMHWTEQITRNVDLHYDSGKEGWYFQEYDYQFGDKISQLFPTEQTAKLAWEHDDIQWYKV